jgi:hypothetical protein
MSCAEIASAYSNTTLKKVVNVYQTQFVDFKASGLGDYLRGSFMMLQLLRTLKKYTGVQVDFDMDLRNHPMSKFLICDPTLEVPENYNGLGNFHIDSLLVNQDENDIAYQHIVREIVRYFNKVQKQTFFAYCCKDIVYTEILDSEKAFIRSRLQPTSEMETYIVESMIRLGVSQPFTTLHVRLDDAVCFPHAVGSSQATLNTQLLEDLITAVRSKIDPSKTYVLVSSSTRIKDALTGGNIKTIPTAICHIGQNQTPTEEELRDTLLDFFLMSRSEEILAFSTYTRTGFSLECANIYGIPYTMTQVEDKEMTERLRLQREQFESFMKLRDSIPRGPMSQPIQNGSNSS